MTYKIIIDSCGELTDVMKQDEHFCNVALELSVDDHHITDDETFDQADFLRRVKESKNCPKSSCPSPESYMEAFGDAERIYMITLSSNLSGSYNSAELAKNIYIEEHPDADIHVFDSRSASVGETLIGLKVQELEEKGLDFDSVVLQTEAYINEQNTFFVLETLDTLRKNGRLSNLKAVVASALSIKPVMGSTPEGTICQLGQARGMTKALDKLIQDMLEKTKNTEERVLAIAHCNCPKRAQSMREKIEKLAKFKDIIVVDTAGVSTMYANDGGVIVAV